MGQSLSAGGAATIATVPADSLSPIDVVAGHRPKVVATTQLAAEPIRAVGGPDIDLSLLVPAGSDPHGYELSPQDVVEMNNADVIFMSGLGYEVFLAKLIGGAEQHPPIVALSDGVDALTMAEELASQPAAAGRARPGEVDPHVWLDPTSVIQWTENAQAALSALDPAHAAQYAERAGAYIGQLQELDRWAEDQVSSLPESHRKLVADHEVLGYLARRYGFTVVGAITPETSDVAEPSAKDLAALETTLRQEGVRAIFVGVYDNHSLADQVASDTGISVVPLYLENLSPSDGPAMTYIDLVRFDIEAIVEALQ